MNTSGEAADQVVRMTLNGVETALKITGNGAEKIGKLLGKLIVDMSKQTKKTKGQVRLNNMIKSGKKLEIFELKDEYLKKFCELSKTYGVVYTLLKDKKDPSAYTEIMVKSDDVQKLNHIMRRLNVAPQSVGEIKTELEREAQNPPERTGQEKSEEDKFIDELMAKNNPTKEVSHSVNPTQARTQRSNQSVPTSKDSLREVRSAEHFEEERAAGLRPSVRDELKELKKELEQEKKNKYKARENSTRGAEHKAPKRKKKEKERN